ncbi:MAG: prepilin peptidase [Polyangiaceae bacterium]|nr:prepilin peptidase [Myxococcales bacterium]MCB9589007.1 prepilin peptidase [Polyangiaceae bacterium]
MQLSDFPHVFLLAFAIPFGLAFGSFLNVVIYRLPRGENLAYPGSACPACGKPIRGYDNIPVLSWVVLRGKARCCQAPISARYPLVELVGGLAAYAIIEVVVMGLPPETNAWTALGLFCANLALTLGLVAAAFIDVEHMILPDEITLGGAVLGFATSFVRPGIEWQESLLGAAIGFLMVWLPFDVLYRKLRGQAGMGLGDAKLLLLAGAWFGWVGAVFALFVGAFQGTLGAIVMLVSRGQISEPEAVQRQREELQQAIEAAEGEEREALLAEFEADPLAEESDGSFSQARLAFGPFLVLAILEYQFFGPYLIAELRDWMLGA